MKRKGIKTVLRIAAILFANYFVLVALIYFRQRAMLYFPSHTTPAEGLQPWSDGQRVIGYCREVANPRTIWLMMHGNAGQASDRDYVLPRMSGNDSLYVLEYPGYGSREGSPSKRSITQSAKEAYRLLRSRNPTLPVCVLGESIGSGPACALAGEKVAPEKIVLVVPFDSLAKVAWGHFPFLPTGLLLKDNWNNVEALKQYSGPVEVYGASNDSVIPLKHARSLAANIPHGHFIEIAGGHNDWSKQSLVRVER